MLDKIRVIAHEKHISLNKLEHEAGMSRGSIWKWDDVPKSIVTLKKIADVLEVPVDELLSEEEKETV